MAQASFRSWVGIATDRINGTMTSATLAAATTLPLSNVTGTPATTHTAFIVDGANSESVAVSAVSVNTATVTGFTYTGSAGNYVGNITVSSWTGGTPAVGSLLTISTAIGGITIAGVNQSFYVTASSSTTATITIPSSSVTGTFTSGGVASQITGCTVGAMTYAHPANTYVLFQTTTSTGPTAYIPVTKLDFSDDYNQLYDKGFRGSNVDIYGAQQGIRMGNISIDGDFFADTAGYLLQSLFGAYDYTANSGTTPNQYAFSPLNYGNAQPAPFVLYDYNPAASNVRMYARSIVSDMTIKADPGALLGYSATIKSFASGVVTTVNPTALPPTFSSFTPVPARYLSATIGGNASNKLETAEYTFKRALDPIVTLEGIQDPLMFFSGTLSVACKASVLADDDVELLRYINQTQPAFVVSGRTTATTSGTGISITTTSANYENVKVMQGGKAWVTVDIPFQALANSTDKTTAGGGLSPVKVILYTGTTGTATLY